MTAMIITYKSRLWKPHGKKRLRKRLGDTKSDFDNYGKHFFGHPTQRDAQGNITAVVERKNNVLEHFFGAEKRKLRRRVGRAHLGRDLEDQPAQAALAANLMCPDYVRVVCGSLENLDAAFAALSEEELERASSLSRDNRDSKLFRRIWALVKNQSVSGAAPASQPGVGETIEKVATVV